MVDIVDVNTLFGPLPAASVDLPVDTLLELMQQRQVGTACTLSTLGLLLDPNIGNAATKAACSEHSELLPAATLNPAMFFGGDAVVTQLKSEGFRMVRFFPDAQGWPVNYAPFLDLAQRIQAAGLPIMVNIEAPGEVTALSQTLDFFTGPVILASLDPPHLAEALAVLRKRANWHLEISGLLSPGALKLVVDSVGAERLLFGSGAPSLSLTAVLNTVRYAELSDTARGQLFSANARRLLNA